MSLADFAFPGRLRTVSAQLRNAAGLDDSHGHYASSELSAPHWGEWNTTGYSSEHQPGPQTGYHDPYGDLMVENAFGGYGSQQSSSGALHHGLGFDVSMQMGGIEEEATEPEGAPGKEEQVVGDAVHEPGDELHRTRLQSRSARDQPSQPYPTPSDSSSPARSRASSLASQHAMSTLTSPASPFFPGPLPSPFREHPASFASGSSATINPSHSVRSSSPSDTSSVSNLNMSRVGSSSAGSSVYGGEGSISTAPSTPYRSGSISSKAGGRASHQKHARRGSSPIKGSRHARKLSNADRKAICQFHLTHPNMKQDDIGAHFGFERSTISKTLKYKEKYLAMASDDEDGPSGILRGKSTMSMSLTPAPEESVSPDVTPNLSSSASATTPQPSPELARSSSVASIFSLETTASTPSSSVDASGRITGGRFPQVDNELAAWARQQVPFGVVLSDAVLQTQAKNIARGIKGVENFKASQTWLEGFKARAGIRGGTFVDMLPGAPLSRAASHQSIRLEDFAASANSTAHQEEDVEGEDDETNGRRRTRGTRSVASKTIHRLAGSRSSLASFDGLRAASASPTPSKSSMDGVEHGGNFSNLSVDSEATPTHSSMHSRASTAAHDRPSGLAGAFAYSPTGGSETAVLGTPSRLQHDVPSPLMLGEYSPDDQLASQQQQNPYSCYDGGLTHSYTSSDVASYPQQSNFGPLSASSSHSSLANYGNSIGASSLACGFGATSPAPSFHHGRSGSTASTNSVYSGLTAFSSHSANGPGTPLTGSLCGSFRNSQNDLCSVPSTPAHVPNSTSYFSLDPSQQSQLQAAFASSSAHQLPLYQQHSQSVQNSHQQHSTHQRYPTPQPSDSSSPNGAVRRATISGGAPFQGRSTAASASLSMTQLPATSSSARPPVTLEQAFSSLEIALEYLSTRAGQDYVSPKDLVVLCDLKGKMEVARNAQGVSLAAISCSDAPSLNSPFAPQQQQSIQSLFPAKQQRLKLARTHSMSSVPALDASVWSTHGGMTRRAGNALSLYEVEGH
ncbi:hypothetical protein JCM1841_004364 [Sporobolomyces salmonicolor]